MWCANQALFGLVGAGQPQDWVSHAIGHELTALYKLDHAQTLAVILPSLLRYCFDDKLLKLAQYGRRVWGLVGGDIEVAHAVFFRHINSPFSVTVFVDTKERTGSWNIIRGSSRSCA